MRIFETHAHYDDEWFDEDRDELINRMRSHGISPIVNIGCSMENSRHIIDMIKNYDFIYGTVGVHPSDIRNLTEADMEELKNMSAEDKILAIGEIGLDYHYDDANKEKQKYWFVRQLDVAKEVDLPVVIHSRDAAKDTLDIIKSEHTNATGGVIHCFSYGKELAREYVNMEYYIGVGGVVTFRNANKLKEVVEYIPLERIVLETDSPYLAPEPFRGKRNCSLYLTYVAEQIAQIKHVPIEKVYETTYKNAKMLYRI